MSKTTIERKLLIKCYEDAFNDFKEKHGLTVSDTWKCVQAELQLWGWADVFQGAEGQIQFIVQPKHCQYSKEAWEEGSLCNTESCPTLCHKHKDHKWHVLTPIDKHNSRQGPT